MMLVNLLTQLYKPIFQLMALFIDFHVQGHHNRILDRMLTSTHYRN